MIFKRVLLSAVGGALIGFISHYTNTSPFVTFVAAASFGMFIPKAIFPAIDEKKKNER